MKEESDDWICVKHLLPPCDVYVKVRGNDYMGYFYLDKLVARKEYKRASKHAHKNWRWVDEDGERSDFNHEIDGWKYIVAHHQP